MNNLILNLKNKKKISRLILLIISLLMNAIIYNIFLLPMNLVTGGANGIATITKYLYHINPSIMLLLISIACGILSLMYLGFERTAGTVMASFIYPLLVQITSPLNNIILFQPKEIFLIVIFSGVLTGIANGLMYKTGYSNGGFPVISQILYDYFKIPIAKSSLVINVLIVLLGSIFFGPTNAMYAIIFLYINSLVLDKVLLGVSGNKAFYIITSKDEAIKDYLNNTLKHSATIFDVKGGFLQKKKEVILTVIPTKEYYRVTEGIKLLDKNAFFVVTDAYEVKGAK